jgi:N-acetyl-1-D-myo-inositol-2-amino-2-deoxy-alpha-D-glucopyranoside deacetylase
MTPATRRMLLVHAHPDDETLTTGGTIAHYRAQGVEVVVLTCTLGEQGEVIGARWAGLVADAADQLGGYRVLELTRALAHLGVAEPRFLGGAGRWRDSGMTGSPSTANPRAFVNADPDTAAAVLAEVIDQSRPHVVITYDERGGYGHPDHIQAHRITRLAVDRATWDVPKCYATVADRDAVERASADMPSVPEGWRRPAAGELPAVPAATVTAAVDVSGVLDAKRAALRAHATQLAVSPDGGYFALSDNVAQPILDVEHFVLLRGAAGPVGAHGRETDLFGGIE